MASKAKVTPARVASAYQMIPVIGPSEGIDLRLSPTLLPPGRARTLTNWSLEEPGALVAAPGWAQFSTVSLGADAIQGAARVYLNTALPTANSTVFTLVARNGAVYLQNDNGIWASTAAAGLTGLNSTAAIFFPSDRDLVAALDGVSTAIFKSTTASTVWTRFGIARPSTGPVLSTSGSTGTLSSAEFEVNFVYKDRDLMTLSNGSSTPSTWTTSVSSAAMNVVMANSTDPQVDAIVVYARNKTSGETVRRKVSSLAQSAGTNSTYVITSSNWTTGDEEPTDHDLPVAMSFAVVWKNRWWGRDATVTNRLRFTQIFQAQSWPTLFYLDVPFERGDALRALLPIGDSLLVFGDSKIFIIIGQTSLDFEVRPTLASQDGALGPRAICLIENGAIHAGASGVWIFDGISDRLLSFDIDPAWRDLIANAAADALRRTACVYHLARKELHVAVARRYPSGVPGEWILDMNRSRGAETAWRASDRDIAGYVSWDGPEPTAGNRGRLLSWPSTTAVLNEEVTGYTANGANQACSYEGPGLTLGAFRGRWVDLRGEYEPHGGALSEQALVDGVAMPANSVQIGSNLAQYSSGLYGTATYAGAGRRQFVILRPLTADGRTYVQTLTYTGTEKMRLYSYHVGLVPEPASRGFSE